MANEEMEMDVMEEELPEESAPSGSLITITSDQIPQISGMQVGDVVTFKVANIGDNAIDLELFEEAVTANSGEGESETSPISGIKESFLK